MNDLFSRKCSFNISHHLWLNIFIRVDCSHTMTPTFTDWEPTTSSCPWTALIKPECAITRGMGHRHLTIKVSPLSDVSGCNLRIVIYLGWRSALMTWLVPSPLLNSMRHAGDGSREVWSRGDRALIEDWETTGAESAFRQLVAFRAVTVSCGGGARDKVLRTSAWGLDNLSC